MNASAKNVYLLDKVVSSGRFQFCNFSSYDLNH